MAGADEDDRLEPRRAEHVGEPRRELVHIVAEPARGLAKALGVRVLPMTKLKEFVREQHVKMAILTVPAHVAQEVANDLIEAGILAVLNFAPIILQVPDHVVVNNVDVAIELENLSYFIQ